MDFLECNGLGNEIYTGFLIMNLKKNFWLTITGFGEPSGELRSFSTT
jgi:hypothetical protein